jgi:tryptophanyl-tRNA synthetase
MAISITGIRPTGTPHLGNYLGMFRPALALARDHESLCFIADLHALIDVRDPAALRARTREIAAVWLACGLDPQRTPLYRQSDAPAICEIVWLVACVTAKGMLNRGHAYKAMVDANRRSGRDPDAGITAGLFDYPLLMAADILAMGAEIVPVGRDQRQHVEAAREIARAFNGAYGGDVLRVPEAIVDERVMTVPGLDGRKMSKSYDNVIPLMAEPDELRRRVMAIVTDSRRPEERKDPDGDTVFCLYRELAPDHDVRALRARYEAGGVGYAETKQALFEALEERMRGPRARYRELLADPGELERVLEAGGAVARARADAKLERMRAAVGL